MIPRSAVPTFLFAMTTILGPATHARAQARGEARAVIGAPGIARFVEKGVETASFPPSLALAGPVIAKEALPEDGSFKVDPLFWTREDGRNCVRIDIDAGTSLYGTGEIAGPLLRNGRKTVCWNTDAYGYTEANASLYQSHPWVLAVRKDGTAFGVLADTTWRCEIDLTGAEKGASASGSIVFRGEGSASGKFPVYVIDRASPQEVMKGLGELIGTIPLPPLWAIGYHQCRYSYNPESRVREIAKNFRDRHIPCDVIWFDIDYMDGYRVFTFDKAQFPDPKKLNDDLDAMGFHRIWMIDPGVKAEPGYSIYDDMVAKNLFVTDAAGKMYRGEVWPGWCVYPDYTRPDVRQWWAGLYKDFMAKGVSGVWNDMNEPAVFNVKSKTMPEDNKHGGGAWEKAGTLPAGPHLQYHNVYGMLMAKGTFDGIQATAPEKRPFVLTRAGYIGSQRYAATWTGDNSAEWKDLENSVSMIANLGLSGQPFSGPDIGGFNGNGDAKLFARWMGVGAMLPFCRGHTGKGNIDKEPWAFGPEVEQTCRLALQRRYALLPYYYTLFWEAHRTGMPVVRPVFFADPKDPALRSEDDAFLVGSDLLVVPQLTPERDRAPAMPKGIWNEFQVVNEGHHPDLPKLFVRGGAIVPMGPAKEHTSVYTFVPGKPADALTIVVSLDENGSAIGKLYEDDREGYGYRNGDYFEQTYTARTENGQVIVEMGPKEGRRFHDPRALYIILLMKDGWYVKVQSMDGVTATIPLKGITPVKFPDDPPAFVPPSAPAKPTH